jgi:hypothetical protein
MINVVNKKHHKPTEYDYYIARPSKLGNPYTHNKNSKYAKYIVETRDLAIDNYKEWLKDKIMNDDNDILNELNNLRNFYMKNNKINLVCWCKPDRCHGDILKEFLEGKLFDNDEKYKIKNNFD